MILRIINMTFASNADGLLHELYLVRIVNPKLLITNIQNLKPLPLSQFKK